MNPMQVLNFVTGHWPAVVAGATPLVAGWALTRRSSRRKQKHQPTAPPPNKTVTTPTGAIGRLNNTLTGSLLAVNALDPEDHRRLAIYLIEGVVDLVNEPDCADVACVIKNELLELVDGSFKADGTCLSSAHANQAVSLVKLFDDERPVDVARSTTTGISDVLLGTFTAGKIQPAPAIAGLQLRRLLTARIRAMGAEELRRDAKRIVGAFVSQLTTVLESVMTDYNTSRQYRPDRHSDMDELVAEFELPGDSDIIYPGVGFADVGSRSHREPTKLGHPAGPAGSHRPTGPDTHHKETNLFLGTGYATKEPVPMPLEGFLASAVPASAHALPSSSHRSIGAKTAQQPPPNMNRRERRAWEQQQRMKMKASSVK